MKLRATPQRSRNNQVKFPSPKPCFDRKMDFNICNNLDRQHPCKIGFECLNTASRLNVFDSYFITR